MQAVVPTLRSRDPLAEALSAPDRRDVEVGGETALDLRPAGDSMETGSLDDA